LIDVIFMLLMFFMLATSFEQWRSIKLTTGQNDSTVEQAQSKSTLLQVYPGYIELNGQRVELLQVGSAVSALKSLEVVVQPMSDTRLQRVVSVMDQLRAAGISNPVLNIN